MPSGCSSFRLGSSDIQEARRTSPLGFLTSIYGKVDIARSGNSLSVDKVLRCDKKPDGTWISCTWYSEGIGDNINLVQHVRGGSFAEAVGAITGRVFQNGQGPEMPASAGPRWGRMASRRRVCADVEMAGNEPPMERQRLDVSRLPPHADEEKAFRWLTEVRGISPHVVTRVLQGGNVRPTREGVMFLGRDEHNTIRYAAMRYYEKTVMPNGKMGNKKDWPSSDKAYPFVLREDDARVVLVEGAVNVLAVSDMMDRAGTRGTIISTGSVGTRRFLQNPVLSAILTRARRVTLYGENESANSRRTAAEQQAATDRIRLDIALEIAELRNGGVPYLRWPPAGFGDAADYNLTLGERHRAALPGTTGGRIRPRIETAV